MPKNSKLSMWILFWLAPGIPLKHAWFQFHLWLSKIGYKLQISALSKAMSITKNTDDLIAINQPNFLFLAISETNNKELKLSGFYAQTEEDYKREYEAVPGEKLIIMSMTEIKDQITKNFMERRFYQYHGDILAKNGGHYVH